MQENLPSVYINLMGHYHPENRVGNDFFDHLGIDSDAAWIEDRTGIESRRSVMRPEDILRMHRGETDLEGLRREGKFASIASLAEKAWELLQKRAESLPNSVADDIDALICGTSIPDYDIPANACTISAALGLSCPSFDTNSACSSFVVDLHVAKALVASGAHHRIALFNPERYSLRVNYEDRSSCVLFGDGCAATIVSDKATEHSFLVLDTLVASDPSGYDLVQIPESGRFSQNGKAVQKFAISKTLEATRAILDRNQLHPNDISYFTGHQANLRMISSAAERLGLSREKHLYNVDRFGNQGAAGAPAVLSEHWERFNRGDLVVVAVVGSGLTWGACLLKRL